MQVLEVKGNGTVQFLEQFDGADLNRVKRLARDLNLNLFVAASEPISEELNNDTLMDLGAEGQRRWLETGER